MKRSMLVCTVSVIALAGLLGEHAAHAQTPAWRCTGADCPDALVSDIEDLTVANWPASLTFAMPPIQITCADFVDPCKHCAVDPNTAGPIKTHTVNWSLGVMNPPRSFLIGRYTADVDFLATFQTVGAPIVEGMAVVNQVWSNTAIDYSFASSTAEVPAPGGGSTGVDDLGTGNFINPSGTFWTDSVAIQVDMGRYQWCTHGSETHTIAEPVAVFHVPFSRYAISDLLAEAIRNQFRSAVRRAVLGVP